jgi:lysophospholipase
MDHFAQLGYASIAMDLRGHGKSGGTRMFIRDMEDYLQDVKAVVSHFADHLQGKSFLIGHSMGGLVVIRFRQVYPDAIPNLTCTVVSSPFLGISAPIPAWKKTASKLVVSLYPKLSMPNGLDANHVSHDPEQVRKYVADPLNSKIATAGWFEAVQRAHIQARANAPQTHGPLHILAAGDDKLVDLAATRIFYAALSPQIDKSLHVFDGWYHEIFNETDKEAAYLKLEDLLKRY